MTDYNDGEWHFWDGSERRPDGVHPESLISYVWHDERTGGYGLIEAYLAKRSVWPHVLKFRVTKPFQEPRVIWVNEYLDGTHHGYDSETLAVGFAGRSAARIAVRYVEAPE